jgi:acyl-coenzyme A thioesterase PaaI-like protein
MLWTMDFDAVGSAMPTLVPMVGTLGLEFDQLDATKAVLRLPDQAAYHNHIGGPHAGAMFTLGESASGALVLGNFADHLASVTPLAVEANIAFKKVAVGPVVATAVMTRTVQEILAELESGHRPEFRVEIALETEDGTVTGQMSVLWTLKPNAPRP